MIIRVTQSMFVDALGDNFSYDAKVELFNWYESCDCDDAELDAVAIRCEWCEYDTVDEALKEYDVESIDELYDNTTVIEFNNGSVLLQSY